jgi:4-amino-4-deoxy-L-arabinose transferase-like glycosyltransferase
MERASTPAEAQPTDRVWRAGLVITALAIVARLVWVVAVPTHPVGDFAMYLESADYLVEHGALDPEFIYMPGYVILLAGVRALGGGLLAAKLVGVAAGGLATASVYGIALAVFDRTSAVAAALLVALWPAGIAVSGVTGTDMPAAALLAAAVWLLVRDGPERPRRAAVLFGLVLGLAAYVRAVALPLAAGAAFYWAALGTPWRRLIARTALGCAVAMLVLLPWGIRNRLHYGELFLTDSHGGHTALVGANPNSDGVYSRSLNLMFKRTTGYELLRPPHREADRAAYALARRWAEVDSDYALGLLGAKADRLLTNERPLLYWPLYRQGVLRGESARWFDAHRAGIEALTDGFWYALVAAALFGVVVAASRRLWPALSILPVPLGLAVLYVLFFAEVRYHLAIAVFLFPFAGAALRWAVQGGRDLVLRRFNARGRRRFLRELAVSVVAIVAVFAGWPSLVAGAAQLRDRHRWGVCVCNVDGRDRLCAFRATVPAPGEGPSPVRGVWNGVGLTLTTGLAGAATDVELPPGRYRVSLLADTATSTERPEARLELRARGSVLAATQLPRPAGAPPARIGGVVEHLGGSLRIEVAAERAWSSPVFIDVPTLWIADIRIESDLR